MRHRLRRGVHGFFNARHRRFKLHSFGYNSGKTATSSYDFGKALRHVAESFRRFFGGLAHLSQLFAQFTNALGMQLCGTRKFFFCQCSAGAQLLQGVVKLRNFLARPVVGVEADSNPRAFQSG